MIEGLDSVAFVDTPYDHHPHQNLEIIDLAWIPGKQRFQGKRTVSLNDDIYL